jgi:hypothetical protein
MGNLRSRLAGGFISLPLSSRVRDGQTTYGSYSTHPLQVLQVMVSQAILGSKVRPILFSLHTTLK